MREKLIRFRPSKSLPVGFRNGRQPHAYSVPWRSPLICAHCFHCHPHRRTDGVFRDLTDARIVTPWIEAFREREMATDNGHVAEQKSQERDLTPKKMGDSYYRVVR